jgi:transposase
MTIKPTLGHPTRRAAVRALSDDGMTAREIAALIGISIDCVWTTLSQSKHLTGDAMVRRWTSREQTVLLNGAFMDALADERRGME